MTPNSFQQQAVRSAKRFPLGHYTDPFIIDLLHAQMGLTTEVGEFTDTVKKHIIYNQPLDEDNLEEELGDILWYCVLAIEALGLDLETVMLKNISKLRKRYPALYSDTAAVERKDKDNA